MARGWPNRTGRTNGAGRREKVKYRILNIEFRISKFCDRRRDPGPEYPVRPLDRLRAGDAQGAQADHSGSNLPMTPTKAGAEAV